MEVVTRNKINQEIMLEMDKDSKEQIEFHAIMKAFAEKYGVQIEGTIEHIYLSYDYSKTLSVRFNILKEDKLKLLADKTINIEAE